MPRLWYQFLPLVQSLNDYGGNFASISIRRPVLDAIDRGAGGDPTLTAIRNKLRDSMEKWTGLQDHETFSKIVESYYEGVFYLTADEHGLALQNIQAGTNKGNTPDFTTRTAPFVNFEVKTIDVAAPKRTYNRTMAEGLNAKLEALAEAQKKGHGTAVQSISPHGPARNLREAVEQVMQKIDSNIKAGQYQAAPTFLTVSLARTAINDRAENLRRWVPLPGEAQDASGQLFAIAAHAPRNPFYLPEGAAPIENIGVIDRAGILLDHDYIPGLIFVATDMSASNDLAPVRGVYSLNGIWNCTWERTGPFGPVLRQQAKKLFIKLCDAWNDTEDSRSAHLPTE